MAITIKSVSSRINSDTVIIRCRDCGKELWRGPYMKIAVALCVDCQTKDLNYQPTHNLPKPKQDSVVSKVLHDLGGVFDAAVQALKPPAKTEIVIIDEPTVTNEDPQVNNVLKGIGSKWKHSPKRSSSKKTS